MLEQFGDQIRGCYERAADAKAKPHHKRRHQDPSAIGKTLPPFLGRHDDAGVTRLERRLLVVVALRRLDEREHATGRLHLRPVDRACARVDVDADPPP